MDLEKALSLHGARDGSFTVDIPANPEADDKVKFALKAMLTPEIAAALGIDYVYSAGSTIAQESLKKATFGIELKDKQMKLKSQSDEVDTFYPDLLNGFSVSRAGDGKWFLHFSVENTGLFDRFLDFFRTNRAEVFEIFIDNRQGQLFEGGTRVDMAPGAVIDGEFAEVGEAPQEFIGRETETDRSYENRQKGGKRGRKPKKEAVQQEIPDEVIAGGSIGQYSEVYSVE